MRSASSALASTGPRSGQESASTLRHTAATWLRQTTGDVRLVAEYLGHTDLSTVSRYAHVARAELHAAAESLADGHDDFQAVHEPPRDRHVCRQLSRVYPGQLAAWD